MNDEQDDAAMLAELRECMGDGLRWERSAWGQRLMHEHGARLLALAEEGLRLRDWRDSLTDWNPPCKGCGGLGRKTYGSTATWRGGIGGQACTTDVCDDCWGTGRADRKGTDLRRVGAEIERLRARVAELEAAPGSRRTSRGDGVLGETRRYHCAEPGCRRPTNRYHRMCEHHE